MFSKKKILFYGNCHLGVISKYFKDNLSEYFEVQKCTDYGLKQFWIDDGLFSVWYAENVKLQNEIFPKIHKIIKEVDIFVFQPIKNSINELNTEYLCNNIATKLKICLPNSRLFIHLTDINSLQPYIEYVKTKTSNNTDLIYYLQNSSDSYLLKLLQNEFPINKNFKKHRNRNVNIQCYEENLKIYDNVININDFLEKEYKNQILCYSHNHMSENYYIELINRLINNIGNINHTVKCVKYYPKNNHLIDPFQFKFFRNYFKGTKSLNDKGRLLNINDIK